MTKPICQKSKKLPLAKEMYDIFWNSKGVHIFCPKSSESDCCLYIEFKDLIDAGDYYVVHCFTDNSVFLEAVSYYPEYWSYMSAWWNDFSEPADDNDPIYGAGVNYCGWAAWFWNLENFFSYCNNYITIASRLPEFRWVFQVNPKEQKFAPEYMGLCIGAKNIPKSPDKDYKYWLTGCWSNGHKTNKMFSIFYPKHPQYQENIKVLVTDYISNSLVNFYWTHGKHGLCREIVEEFKEHHVFGHSSRSQNPSGYLRQKLLR